jgi:putative transposase
MIDSVSFSFHHKKQGVGSMVNSFSLIKDYLVDQEAGIHHLITLFLNLVREEEALFGCGAKNRAVLRNQ